MAFERLDVVRVPFPFTDRQATKNRPALIVSEDIWFNRPAGHSVMAMITSASHSPWPLDCAITDLATAGLPAASVIRWKLFTLDHHLIRGVLGRLSKTDAAHAAAALAKVLSLSPPVEPPVMSNLPQTPEVNS